MTWLAVAEIVAALSAATVVARAVVRLGRSTRTMLPRRPRSRRGGDPGLTTALARADHAAGAHLAGDVHVVLRPLLTEMAVERLLDRGVELEREPAHARAILGDDLWDVVRPDRPPPEDGFERVLEPSRLAALLDRLEAM